MPKGSTRPLLERQVITAEERSRFLDAMDRVAPHLWIELRDAASPLRGRDGVFLQEYKLAQSWCARHHLGNEWVVQFAIYRLWRYSQTDAAATGWHPMFDSRAISSSLGAQWPAPEWKPGQPETEWRQETEQYAGFVKKLRGAGRLYSPASERDLERVVRWHVLRESPEQIAKLELQNGAKGNARDRAKDIGDVVKRLAGVLQLPPRPPGRPGRKQLRG